MRQSTGNALPHRSTHFLRLESRFSSLHIQTDHCPSTYLPALPALTFYLKSETRETKILCPGLIAQRPEP